MMADISVATLNSYRMNAARDSLRFSVEAESHLRAQEYQNAAFWAVASLEESGRAILCTEWVASSHPDTLRVNVPSKAWNAVLHANAEDGHQIRLQAVQAGTAVMMNAFLLQAEGYSRSVADFPKERVRSILRRYPSVTEMVMVWMRKFLDGSPAPHRLHMALARRAISNKTSQSVTLRRMPARTNMPSAIAPRSSGTAMLQQKVRTYVGWSLLAATLLRVHESAIAGPTA